jgi:hypothetical protein
MLCWNAKLARQSTRAFLNIVYKCSAGMLSWLGNLAGHYKYSVQMLFWNAKLARQSSRALLNIV